MYSSPQYSAPEATHVVYRFMWHTFKAMIDPFRLLERLKQICTEAQELGGAVAYYLALSDKYSDRNFEFRIVADKNGKVVFNYPHEIQY